MCVSVSASVHVSVSVIFSASARLLSHQSDMSHMANCRWLVVSDTWHSDFKPRLHVPCVRQFSLGSQDGIIRE